MSAELSKTPPRYPLIVNLNARGARSQRSLRAIMVHAKRFAIYATNHAQEARELAAKLAKEGAEVVVGAGGDGTLNNIVQGLAGTATALGILPTGTMNVFARELGLPLDDVGAALAVIDQGRYEEVDLFQANGHAFFQMAGVGLDAQVIDETKWELKKALGPLAYLVSAVKVLGDEPPRLEVCDAEGGKHYGVCCLLGNGGLYGGQFKMFPNASNRDQLLDVIIFKESGYRLVLEAMRGLAQGQLNVRSDMIEYFTAGNLEVSASGKVPVEADGELVTTCPVRFKRVEKTLRVMAPSERQGSWFEDTLRAIFKR